MNDYKDAIINTLEYIESHLTESLTLDHITQRVHYSKFYFSRLFIFYVGTSIMDYVLTRKLTHVARLIKQGYKPSDIVYQYGFETQSGFNKAFKRKFGVSPSKFSSSLDIKIPPLIMDRFIQNDIKGEILMEPRIVIKETTKLVGVSIDTTTQDGKNLTDIPTFWQNYLHDGTMERLHSQPCVKSHEEYGVCHSMKPSGEFKYLIGVEVNDKEVLAEFETYTLNKQLYAVFTTPKADDKDFSDKIQDTWRFIYGTWFKHAPYVYDPNGIEFELYDERSIGDTDKVMDIYIPIKPKE